MEKTKDEQTASGNAPKDRERLDVYGIVTDRIIGLLEAGVVPWHKPWSGGQNWPKNLVSGKEYRGINVLMLSMAGYGSPYWLSYKQARERGGYVREGEKSSIAVFWKQLEVKDKDNEGKTKRVPLLRYYRVFNVEQCEGIEYPKPEAKLPAFNPIEAAEGIVAGMPSPPTITHNEQRAFYNRGSDVVNMPKRETFDSESNYYATLLHELTHSTGHDSRLARLQNSTSGFGSSSYAKEELVAEVGASFLCAHAGILDRVVDNSASYINAWLGRLKDDRKLVVQAAAAAQKSSDYILGRSYGSAQDKGEEAAQ